AELETIVLKALEKNPADRYATAQELGDDLRRFLEDKPIRARRPTWRQRLTRWGRRHKPLVGAAAAVLLVGVVVLAAAAGWVAHDHATRRAVTEREVKKALDEADGWQQKRRLPEALSAARRALSALAGGHADETLKRRVKARVADLEFVDRL